VGANPNGVVFNPNNNKLYVAVTNASVVRVLDATKNTIIANISVPGNPFSLALNPRTNLIYVTNSGTKNMSVINSATDMVTAAINIHATTFGVAVNPMTNMIYTGSFDDDILSVINGTTNKVLPPTDPSLTYGTTGIDNAYSVAVDPLTNTVYVGAYHGLKATRALFSIVNGKTSLVVGNLTINAPRLTALVVDPNTGLVYIANPIQNLVHIYDPSKKALVANITATGAWALALNQKTLYVTNSASNRVTVINIATNAVLGTFQVGNAPSGIALNTGTRTVYVTNAKDGTVLAIDASTVPG
jgi:YVTN family beta-propeller protein